MDVARHITLLSVVKIEKGKVLWEVKVYEDKYGYT
jgi:hypothetical protein